MSSKIDKKRAEDLFELGMRFPRLALKIARDLEAMGYKEMADKLRSITLKGHFNLRRGGFLVRAKIQDAEEFDEEEEEEEEGEEEEEEVPVFYVKPPKVDWTIHTADFKISLKVWDVNEEAKKIAFDFVEKSVSVLKRR